MSNFSAVVLTLAVALSAVGHAAPSADSPPIVRRQAACVTQQQMIAVNAQTNYWPRCSASQGAFPGDGKTAAPSGYTWGDYCEVGWVAELNKVLVDIGICDNLEAKTNFLAEVAFETGYYTTLGQPIDGGSGVIHMIPANWDRNAQDMASLWPNDGIPEAYSRLQGTLFTQPQYAWKSVAAWYLKSSCAIMGSECCDDLLHAAFDTQTKCILGTVNDRSQARAMVAKALSL